MILPSKDAFLCFVYGIATSWKSVAVTIVTVWIISRVSKLINGLKAVNYLPGVILPFQPLALPGALLPTSWWNLGMDGPWVERFRLYKHYNAENISVIPFISGRPTIYTSNVHVMRQVAAGGHKTSWIKPEYSSKTFTQWGMNLFGAEGEVWRRHRRIMGPAFNNETYTRVWDQTIKSYNQMIKAEGWEEKTMVDAPIVQKLTFKLAFLIFGSCGFGFPFTWSEPMFAPDSRMSIQESLRIVSERVIFALVAPKLAYKIPNQWVQDLRTARSTLERFMQSQITARKASILSNLVDGHNGNDNKDVFSLLVRANELEAKEKLRLTDQEVIGNVFLLLFAGHETTAHTLAATLGYLGLYQDVQDEVVEQILAVVGKDRQPTFDDYPQLNKVLAVFLEALRMVPAGAIMFREATEDTVLDIPNPVGQSGFKPMAVPKGMTVIVDMVGIQYNPRYFPESHVYRPSRWHGTSGDSEAFTAFSVGPRTCIGRKFATTEAVCFLTLLLRDWKVEPILREGETKLEWQERVLQAELKLTLAVRKVPVRFTRRN